MPFQEKEMIESVTIAIENRDLSELKQLEEMGADLSDGNYLGWAVQSDSPEILDYLLQRNAQVAVNDYYAMRVASDRGYLSCFLRLLKAGSDVHAQDDYCLVLSTTKKHFDVMMAAIWHGANTKRLTPIMFSKWTESDVMRIFTPSMTVKHWYKMSEVWDAIPKTLKTPAVVKHYRTVMAMALHHHHTPTKTL